MTNVHSRRNFVKRVITLAAAAPGIGLFSDVAFASKALIYTGKSDNLALGGHDAVAYFKQGAAIEGVGANSLDYNGAQWLFSSVENRQQFEANPEAFAPQFGGYCAFSVAKGKLYKGDPTLWAIEEGKLYVNFSKGIHALWLKRKEQHIAKAKNNWPNILS